MQQVSECEIPFADRSEAMAILGDHDEFLKLMHAEFGCMVVSRGDGIDVSGDPRDVGAVCSLIRELVFLYRQGARITSHEVRYGIKLVKNGQSDELHSLFDDTILVTARGRSVRPKTLGQGRYIDVIRHHDVTFGIGPAGTGKTYLAVVLAVAALRTHSVERIVLTRPAVEAGEKLGFLPEAQNDMIFSIICEELGLFGAVSILIMFILLIWRFMVIANNAPDLFGALLVVGVMGHIAIQVILNVAVVTNTIPNTGISLPFISYGGSAVMFLLIEVGIVLSVGRGIPLKDL